MPLPFKGASGAAIGKKVFFFGGYGGGYSDETHVLDLARPLEPEWTVLDATPAPPRRAYHSTFAHGGSLWVFGGVGPRGLMNDVWRLNFEPEPKDRLAKVAVRRRRSLNSGSLSLGSRASQASRGSRASRASMASEGPRGTWTLADTVGARPSRREGHAAAVVGDTFVVIGGYDGHDWLNDVHLLNLDTLVWWSVAGLQAGAPVPRSGHAAARAPEGWDAVFIFGGFNADGCVPPGDFAACLEFDALAGVAEWLPIDPKHVAPSERYGLSAVAFASSIYVFGGTGPAVSFGAEISREGAICHNDISVFSLMQPHKPVWRRDPHGHAFPGEPPVPRHCHAAVICENRIAIAGGSTVGPYCPRDPFPRLLNDVHMLTLATRSETTPAKVVVKSWENRTRAPTRVFDRIK